MILLVTMAAAACERSESAGARVEASPADLETPLASITADDLLRHTRALASDGFEGRAPGTAGEDSTVAYLEGRFREMGLEPGNPDGSFVQEVPLIAVTARPTASFRAGGRTVALSFPADYVALSRHPQPRVDVADSEIVFVGYGVDAPEFGWNDYEGVDVRGKTVVILINDPPIPDAADPARLDSAVFRGDAMTYYGRWTYKYEEASERGAAAAIIVHETGPAGYPFEVIQGSMGRENFDIRQDGAAERVQVEGWMTREKSEELFRTAGQDFEALKRAAATRGFRPVPLGATATFGLDVSTREVRSRNVVARLPGAHPERRDEYVVYTAHWDHIGRDTTLTGDQIYNGAHDNASGTATLLEIAEAFAALETPPDRSILFLAVTAEEFGLLGAKYYATHPLYPLERTVANLNMDGANQWGRTRDVVVIGSGNTTLEEVLAREATAEGRTITDDPEPEKGFFYRSDHFELAKVGVPALYIDTGTEFTDRPAEYGRQKREEYTANDYHKPSDEIKPDWDLSGAAEDARLLFRVGYRVAQTPEYPAWNEGTEFRARREEMLRR